MKNIAVLLSKNDADHHKKEQDEQIIEQLCTEVIADLENGFGPIGSHRSQSSTNFGACTISVPNDNNNMLLSSTLAHSSLSASSKNLASDHKNTNSEVIFGCNDR